MDDFASYLRPATIASKERPNFGTIYIFTVITLMVEAFLGERPRCWLGKEVIYLRSFTVTNAKA